MSVGGVHRADRCICVGLCVCVCRLQAVGLVKNLALMSYITVGQKADDIEDSIKVHRPHPPPTHTERETERERRMYVCVCVFVSVCVCVFRS